MSRETHYRKLEFDPVYRAAFTRAEQQAGQALEDLAAERAFDGDNQLLVVLLKRFRPELYRDRTSIEHSGSVDLVERMRAADQRLIALQRNAPPTGTDSR